MRGIKTAIGIAAVGLLTIAATAAADTGGWSAGQSASTGNLYHPSMVEDSNAHEHVVARGDTGIWYITDKSGNFVRTRITQDALHRSAVNPLIAVNAGGTLTVVYAVDSDTNTCGSVGLRYIVRTGGSWSSQTVIPGTKCETATGLLVHGSKIYLATYYQNPGNGAARVTYTTNASGSWTHVVVASGLSKGTHISSASLATYDGKPMLAYIKHNHVIYARGLTSTGSFTHETAAATSGSAYKQPSVAINPSNDWPMTVWAQSDGTHYAYRNANGWYSYRVMDGSARALLAFDSTGHGHIAAADGNGGLWYAIRSGGTWNKAHVDSHIVSDLGGIGFGDHVEISYIRGASHLYWASSYSGC